MSNNPNFVSELVQMARAFEELPVVQADLMSAKNDIVAKAEAIQRLELRLIDLKNEVDAAREATRKAEVERDHAENMFLETDDKLGKLRDIYIHFLDGVEAFDKATQPQPVAQPDATAQPKAEASPAEGPGSAHEVTVESPLAETGLPVPTSDEPPVTSTDTASNTTSPAEVGLSGNTDSGGQGEHPLSGAEPSQSGPTSDARDTASVTSGSEGQSAADPTQESVESLASASNTESSVPTTVSQASQTDGGVPQDDVGYHNEPDIGSSDWLGWYDRMNFRYGNRDGWPARTA